MKKVILMKGLPASGKTTWAKKYQKDNPDAVRVNKDELRAMLHDSVWSRGREDFVLQVRDFIIKTALEDGHQVIVDDTNLSPKHIERVKRIAIEQYLNPQTDVEIKDFTDVSPEICIRRDLNRPNPVGSRVIMGMYEQFLRPAIPKITINPNLPRAIVCDIDGTLAIFGRGVNPYDRDFSKDSLNETVAELVRLKSDTQRKIILVSGRKEANREVTEKWLKDHGVPFEKLLMRQTDDNRKDYVVKKEIYEAEIRGKYNVEFVVDDRNQVVRMWREQGLVCLQVADGDF